MANAAEKRQELEAKLAKITGADLQAKIDEQKKALEEEIAKLSEWKDYEGRIALVSVGGFKVKVIVNGYSRMAFRRALFSVSPIEGEGSANFSLDKLQFEDAPVTAGATA